MEMKLPQNCPMCHNQCPSGALKGGRGRAYFEALRNGETPSEPQRSRERTQSENPLVRLLASCGRTAEHRSERVREHGADEAQMFQCLTENERAELQRILEKLDETWREEHAKHHGDHGHREKHHEH